MWNGCLQVSDQDITDFYAAQVRYSEKESAFVDDMIAGKTPSRLFLNCDSCCDLINVAALPFAVKVMLVLMMMYRKSALMLLSKHNRDGVTSLLTHQCQKDGLIEMDKVNQQRLVNLWQTVDL